MSDTDKPCFLVALNLPHAGRIARRILPLLPAPARGEPGSGAEAAVAQKVAVELADLLDPCLDSDENPPGPASARLQNRAAILGRTLVDHIERGGFGHDRLGQCARNLFERLELGREGAEISRRAGENPQSMQRPR